jgi:hypothetical protein
MREETFMKSCAPHILRLFFGVALAITSAAPAATPCPPPQVSAQGGTSASTACPNTPAGAFSTNFATAENPLSEGGKWVTGKATGLDWNNPKSTGGKATASVQAGLGASRYDDSIAHVNSSTQAFNANQYAQGTVYLASGYSGARHEVELLLRFSISGHNAHGYEILWGLPGYIAVVRWNGSLGNYTPVYDPGTGSIPPPRDGDVLRAEISGNTLTIKRNGSTVATVNVSSIGGTVWSSGQPGIGFWPVDGATPENMGWKSFEAGNL